MSFLLCCDSNNNNNQRILIVIFTVSENNTPLTPCDYHLFQSNFLKPLHLSKLEKQNPLQLQW